MELVLIKMNSVINIMEMEIVFSVLINTILVVSQENAKRENRDVFIMIKMSATNAKNLSISTELDVKFMDV